VTETDSASLSLRSPTELQRLREGVMVILRRELRNNTLADDICNEVFRIVLERLRQQPLEDPEKLAPYLAQTARFLARSHHRTVRRRRTFTGQQDAIEDYGDPDADPASATQAEDRAKAVRQVLSEIPNVRDREILVRIYLHDQDKAQVCRELGIDESHFRRVIFRARERCRLLLEKRYRVSDLYSLVLA